jgi:hypothetical protein
MEVLNFYSWNDVASLSVTDTTEHHINVTKCPTIHQTSLMSRNDTHTHPLMSHTYTLLNVTHITMHYLHNKTSHTPRNVTQVTKYHICHTCVKYFMSPNVTHLTESRTSHNTTHVSYTVTLIMMLWSVTFVTKQYICHKA